MNKQFTEGEKEKMDALRVKRSMDDTLSGFDKEAVKRRILSRMKDAKQQPPSRFHDLMQRIAIYFNEPYGFWVRNFRNKSEHMIEETFNWVRSLDIPKKNKARILMDQFKRKEGEKK